MPSVSLKLEDIVRTFPNGTAGGAVHRVLDRVSFEIESGETLGIQGASGAGKTTLGLIAAGLEPPSSGRVLYGGRAVSDLTAAERRRFRREVQMVFQNPEGSLNPLKTVENALNDVMRLTGVPSDERPTRMRSALEEVGLSEDFLCRLPRQLSGGQNQRVVLARALEVSPAFLILDEPAAALDPSERARLLHLLKNTQEVRGLGFLFISHAPAAVEFMTDRIARLENGRLT